MRADLCSPPVPTRNFGFRGPRNLRLGARCIVVDRESLSLISETIVLQYWRFKLDKKRLISINGKKKFKRILSCLFGGRRKVQVTKSAFEDFILFFSRLIVCPVLKHNRVSEVSKGFKVHEFEHYGQGNYVLKWKFNLCYKKCVIYFLFMLTLTIKKLLENALRFQTDVVLNILQCSADSTCMDVHKMQEV